jgi:calcium-translocating P-type ATPase
MLTGESAAEACDSAASSADEPLRAKNVLLAATTVVTGRVRAVVYATGAHTEFGAITALVQRSDKALSPLGREIAHSSRVILALALAIAACVAAAGSLIGIPPRENFIFAIGIIVAMVPEGLQPTLTLALALASQRMARRRVLIRHLAAVEALGSTSVICTDKTGTLTQNRMRVQALLLGSRVERIEGVGCDPRLAERYRPFFLAAALCHDLVATERDGATALLGDPMEIALAALSRSAVGPQQWRRLDELPFDGERMRLTTVHDTPDGPMLCCKGAPEALLPLCTRVLDDGRIETLDETRRNAIAESHASMARRGLRVLAFAYRPAAEARAGAPVEEDLVFAGLAGLEDPPRPEVPEAMRRCREAGIRVIMLTGDHPSTALAVAREIGLVHSGEPVVITGEALRRLTEAELQLALDAPEILFARLRPDQKLRIVEALKRKREIVAVTGDGVNDAPALKSAHIGVAMGLSGTDVARSASDVVLLDDNFASIVEGIEEGRAVFDNIRKLLTYILAHNVPELAPYVAHALLPVPLALTPIQMLAVDMGTDSLTALGLGVEKAGPGVMQRPPRPPGERLFNHAVALRAYLFLGLIESAAALSAFFVVLHAGGWTYGAPLATGSALYMRATTACLIAIVVMQCVNVFLCRSAERPLGETGVRGNPLILCGVALAVGLALAIACIPALNAFFGTAPVGVDAWLIALPFAAAMIALEALRRRLARRRRA